MRESVYLIIWRSELGLPFSNRLIAIVTELEIYRQDEPEIVASVGVWDDFLNV